MQKISFQYVHKCGRQERSREGWRKGWGNRLPIFQYLPFFYTDIQILSNFPIYDIFHIYHRYSDTFDTQKGFRYPIFFFFIETRYSTPLTENITNRPIIYTTMHLFNG